jgi:hypothetical protein
MRLYHFLSHEYAIKDLEKKRVKISRIDKLNDPFELQAGFTKPNKKIRAQFSQWKSIISKEVGIFCCSKDWRNPLLWSHYADKHTGIALGFDMPERKAIEVKYSKERPLFTSASSPNKPNNTEYLEKLSRTKFISWAYEEEVRFVYPLNSLIYECGNYFNPFDNQMILKEVIVGCNSSATNNEILTALKGFTNITLIWSRMAYKSFRIVKNLQKVYRI